MKWLDRLRGGSKAKELTYDQIASLIDDKMGGWVGNQPITAKAAIQVSTVLACCKAIADGCATPDLHVYRELADNTRERATNIPEYRLLARRPNAWQTSLEWRRMMTFHAVLTGSALSIKVRGANGRVRELLPVNPGNWDVRKVSRYEMRYRCWDQFGEIGDFTDDEVFVLEGLQWEWGIAMNAVQLARRAVGLAIASEKAQLGLHENGLRPSGTYTVEGTLNEDQHRRLTDMLREKAGRPHEPFVLDRSAKWTPHAMTGSDAQAIEQRRMQVEEICRVFGVFPIMVGHSDKTSTFASSEAFFAAHVKHTLQPWLKAWTHRIDEMLLDGAGPLFAEFDTRYLLAGSMRDRAVWARTMAEMGIYTRNELRDEEGMDPLVGLDDPLTPMNMGGSQPQGQGNAQDPNAGP